MNIDFTTLPSRPGELGGGVLGLTGACSTGLGGGLDIAAHAIRNQTPRMIIVLGSRSNCWRRKSQMLIALCSRSLQNAVFMALLPRRVDVVRSSSGHCVTAAEKGIETLARMHPRR